MRGVNAYINLSETGQVKLNGNESYIVTKSEVQRKISMKMNEVDLNRYPDDEALNLRRAYGKYVGVSDESIIAGNGSDEMISLVIGAYVGSGKKLLTLLPDFSMYDFYASLYGGEVIKLECKEDGSYLVEDLIRKGKEEEVDLIIFSNPNNPTGFALSKEEIIKVLLEFKDKKVLIDEAYYEFNGETVVDLINEYKNLFVTRTLSKAWGLAALRVGFLVSNKDTINELKIYKVPYNISTLSQQIATEIIKDSEEVIKNSKEIVLQRENLYGELKKVEKDASLEIKFYPSKANYIYGRTQYKNILMKSLKESGIVIRNFQNEDTFRITVGSPMQNNKVVQAIRGGFVYGEY